MSKKKYVVCGTKVGILGGGQLARMLVIKGHEMGLQMHVLSADANDPAAQVTSHWHKGNVYSEQDLSQFLSQVEFASFESEFLNPEKLNQALKNSRVILRPQIPVMAQIQDRLSQKNSLVAAKIPTAPFIAPRSVDEAEDFFKTAGQVVFKKRLLGYDGYGTFIVKNKKQFDLFMKQFGSQLEDFIVETMIPFRRELSQMAARSQNNECVFFPLVQSHQTDSRCDWVMGPIHNSKIKTLNLKLKKFLNQIEYDGVIAFELFDTGHELLVNEVAPRVHNTGHYSLDALDQDQFSLHLKCVLGLELGRISSRSAGFAMKNLIGTGQNGGLNAEQKKVQWNLPGDVKMHWYGKLENRPGRKMGHINCLGSSAKRALNQVKKACKGVKI